MAESAVDPQLQIHYDDFYRDPALAEWRRLGAIDKTANILALCRDIPHDSVLEIGAGNGAILENLSAKGFAREYRALDISSSGIDIIRSKNIPGLVEATTFDGYRTPYADNQFDLVILSHVVEHVEHPRLLLYEAARVGKRLFVEIPLEDNIRLPDDFVFDPVGHINIYSRKTMRRLLQSCRFRVLGETVANHSKAIYRFQKGARGLVNYAIKEILLRTCPHLATSLYVYHAAFLCEKAGNGND